MLAFRVDMKGMHAMQRNGPVAERLRDSLQDWEALVQFQGRASTHSSLSGESESQILAAYPQPEPKDIRAPLAYAAEVARERMVSVPSAAAE